FIHAYANPDHERRAADVVRDARPDVYTCTSTELSGEAREYERTCTAVANAYVGPLVATYIAELAAYLERSGSSAPLLITQSNGGVMTSDVAVRQPMASLGPSRPSPTRTLSSAGSHRNTSSAARCGSGWTWHGQPWASLRPHLEWNSSPAPSA